MNELQNALLKIKQERQKQENTDNLAVALSTLVGANVVKKNDFDKLNQEKKQLLDTVKDIGIIKMELLKSQCKFFAFKEYHSQWKPTTRKFEKRLSKLKSEKLYLTFNDYPKDIAENLKEAYNCYINGLSMACYIMILRTIEITVSIIYEQHNPKEYKSNGQPKFVPASVKLNWVKNESMIGGADYTLAKAFIEARNDSVHELFVPTEKQIFSAFETVINLITKLKVEIKN
ncbi:hypothetical protein ACFSQ0_05370 [Mesonia sediminis]|uniref:DUF4145 domain-containing protein n=1 Tax=Mesonia sediminis TaxID=1703946 RepID=A0ABW5SCE1_9FLAO